MDKTFRLNRAGSSQYAVFVIKGDSGLVGYRHFEYYLGPLIEERTVDIDKARAKYRAMVANGWYEPHGEVQR